MKWQQRLLSEDALTYDRTLKLLLAMEAAEKEARDISGIKDVHNVHHKCLSPIYNSHPKPRPEHQRSKSCSCCGGNHNQANCSFIMRNISTVIRKGIFQQCVFRRGGSNRGDHLKINNTNTLRENRIKYQEGLRRNLLIRWRRLQNRSNRPNTR